MIKRINLSDRHYTQSQQGYTLPELLITSLFLVVVVFGIFCFATSQVFCWLYSLMEPGSKLLWWKVSLAQAVCALIWWSLFLIWNKVKACAID